MNRTDVVEPAGLAPEVFEGPARLAEALQLLRQTTADLAAAQLEHAQGFAARLYVDG